MRDINLIKIICLLLLTSTVVIAEILPIPKNFKCSDTSHGKFCHSDDLIINITKKKREQKDDISNYGSYLKKKLFHNQIISKVINVKRIKLDNRTWIHAIHQDSELPGFTTTYLASTNAQYGYVISISAPTELYVKKSSQIESLIKAIKLE